jgi:formate dehydrogenase major subunit
VEIEQQRTLQPACTFPIFDGMVIQTESERVVASRVFALQMIFSERTHYCMFCPASGGDNNTDCELQKLAYRYGMTCWAHTPNYRKQWPVDATGQYFIYDQGRCILCRRCVRACRTISANHTLGVHNAGRDGRRDDAVPLGLSTCVSWQLPAVCPTGTDGSPQFLPGPRNRRAAHQNDMPGLQRRLRVECLTRDNLCAHRRRWSGHNGGGCVLGPRRGRCQAAAREAAAGPQGRP